MTMTMRRSERESERENPLISILTHAREHTLQVSQAMWTGMAMCHTRKRACDARHECRAE